MPKRSERTKVLYVHHPTEGLRRDVEILDLSLRLACEDFDAFWLEIPIGQDMDYAKSLSLPPFISEHAPFDVAFFFEHLFGFPELHSKGLIQRRILIPNPEWLWPQDESDMRCNPLFAILHKSTFSLDVISPLLKAAEKPIQSVVGWTSETPLAWPDGTIEKDFDSCVHVMGTARQKQTEIVLETWMRNHHFPKLTVVANAAMAAHLPAAAREARNVQILLGPHSSSEIRSIQWRAGIHVYPSYAEGFGHALNEARAAGSVLVTTDAAPMRDLVQPGVTGFLVPVHEADIQPLGYAKRFNVRTDELAATMERLLSTPKALLRSMGEAGRQLYLADRERFQAAIRRLFDRTGAVAII